MLQDSVTAVVVSYSYSVEWCVNNGLVSWKNGRA